jgi:hypothetical protein
MKDTADDEQSKVEPEQASKSPRPPQPAEGLEELENEVKVVVTRKTRVSCKEVFKKMVGVLVVLLLTSAVAALMKIVIGRDVTRTETEQKGKPLMQYQQRNMLYFI